MKLFITAGMLSAAFVGTRLIEPMEAQLAAIGPVETVTEVSSGLRLPARIDTGAACTSMHCEAMRIENAVAKRRDNIGKPIRFLITHRGREVWIQSVVTGVVKVRTSERSESRYKVPLTLRCNGIEKHVDVTLNNRGAMKFPVLIGRNFLSGDFIVDVELNSGR